MKAISKMRPLGLPLEASPPQLGPDRIHTHSRFLDLVSYRPCAAVPAVLVAVSTAVLLVLLTHRLCRAEPGASMAAAQARVFSVLFSCEREALATLSGHLVL